MTLTRRNFLRAAVLAPLAAAAAPLLGEGAYHKGRQLGKSTLTQEYVRFRAASLGGPVRGQILFMANITCQSPRMSRCLVGIEA